MAKKLILITGGCHSGKSRYAIELANNLNQQTVYVATMLCQDEDIKERVKAQKKNRPADWQTVEEGKNVDTVLMNIRGLSEVVIIDCLTMLTSNLLADLKDFQKVYQRMEALLKVITDSELTVIVVTNEIGSGTAPDKKTGRKFRALAGSINQLVAHEADEIYLMVMGIPMKIK